MRACESCVFYVQIIDVDYGHCLHKDLVPLRVKKNHFCEKHLFPPFYGLGKLLETIHKFFFGGKNGKSN